MKICKKLLKEIAEKYGFELGDNPIKSIHDNSSKISWDTVSRWKLSEDFVREFQDKVNWIYISAKQVLSEDFIREFQDKVNWLDISFYQTLSEGFIREFQDKVDWSGMSYKQRLSPSFIREFQDKVNWHYILRCQECRYELNR
jgi:hypothetical protein